MFADLVLDAELPISKSIPAYLMKSTIIPPGMPELLMLRIHKSTNGQVVLTISGRIEADDIQELEKVLAAENSSPSLVLDLKDVTLVNQQAVEFLARCKANSIQLRRCPAYIHKWIEQGKGGAVQR